MSGVPLPSEKDRFVTAPSPKEIQEFERLLGDFLPASIPSTLRSNRSNENREMWMRLAATPPYAAMTVWVMTIWPNRRIERVDPMVRMAIAGAHYVWEDEWSTVRLIRAVDKAGRRKERREVRQHLGRRIHFVSLDTLWFEPIDETPPASVTSSLGSAVVANLKQSLGEHSYMVTPSASVLLDRFADIAVDHLNSVRIKSISDQCPNGLADLALFEAARPTKRTNKLNRITDIFRDLPPATSVALSHLLLGTDHNPESALLWRHVSGISPLDVRPDIVADWRSELPALCPSMLDFTDRRRRRMRDRSRNGDNLRQIFDRAVISDLDVVDRAMAV